MCPTRLLLLVVALLQPHVHVRHVRAVRRSAGGVMVESANFNGAGRSLLACKKENASPRIKLTLTPIDFAFTLLSHATPQSCEEFSLLRFKACSKDIGSTSGCCSSDCTEMLNEIQATCWNDIQRVVCTEKSPQAAVMMDLLMRRCDVDRREVWCTQSCEEQVLKPKANLTISGFRFGFEVRNLRKPTACTNFQWEDLEACTEDIAVESGCCKKECTAVMEKISDGCMSALTRTLCTAPSDQTAIVMDLLSRRCDPQKREISCPTVRKCELNDTCDGENRSLLKAAKDGNATEVERAIAEGADVDTKDESGATPLDWASFHGNLQAVELLIIAGASVKTSKIGGWTPLDSAALNGHVDVVKALIAAGADPNASAENGATPLHSAVYGGHQEVVIELVAAGAKTDIAADKGWTPLHNAAYFGHVNIIKALVAGGADIDVVNYWGWTPLHWAAYQGHVPATRILIAAGASVSAETKKSTTQEGVFYPSARTPLHIAAASGHSTVVKVLLTNGANKSKRDSAGNTARDVVHSDADRRDALLELLE